MGSTTLRFWRRRVVFARRRWRSARRVLHRRTGDEPPWRAAERQAALYLQSVGATEVTVTRNGADGGIDVFATGIAAQVKHAQRPVGRPVVQQIVGASAPERLVPCVFSSSGYTAPAIRAAAETGTALFVFDPVQLAIPLTVSATTLVDALRSAGQGRPASR